MFSAVTTVQKLRALGFNYPKSLKALMNRSSPEKPITFNFDFHKKAYDLYYTLGKSDKHIKHNYPLDIFRYVFDDKTGAALYARAAEAGLVPKFALKIRKVS
ncbi:MAG: hypothetical protein LBE38_08015 [Deltaproteobacteria bacterium]|jgi:hypothetical protein|nr:hypothetical protein [Deltaproteobacteria bacterium]